MNEGRTANHCGPSFGLQSEPAAPLSGGSSAGHLVSIGNPDQVRYQVQPGESDQNVDDAGYRIHGTESLTHDLGDQVKLEEADQPPVQRAHDDQQQGYEIQRFTHLALSSTLPTD